MIGTGPLGGHAVETGLVIRAIGYRGTPLDGIPFDERRGVIRSADGRVEGSDREYVVGWIKRGPSGVIGTNKKCAQDTVDRIVADLGTGALTSHSGRTAPPDPAWTADLDAVVLAEHWLAIDRKERAAGEASGRPRVKLCTRDELLEVAHGVRV